MSPTPSTPPADEPIQSFSHCHLGILGKLDSLAELPALLAPATRAREIATQAVGFFSEAIFEHHADEERELFPAVLESAAAGAERDTVQARVNRLVAEHRQLEALWKQLEPGLKKLSRGQVAPISETDLQSLVARYRAHAQYEEQDFLPLAQTILGRNANHMAALGLSLHMRHTPVSVPGYI